MINILNLLYLLFIFLELFPFREAIFRMSLHASSKCRICSQSIYRFLKLLSRAGKVHLDLFLCHICFLKLSLFRRFINYRDIFIIQFLSEGICKCIKIPVILLGSIYGKLDILKCMLIILKNILCSLRNYFRRIIIYSASRILLSLFSCSLSRSSFEIFTFLSAVPGLKPPRYGAEHDITSTLVQSFSGRSSGLEVSDLKNVTSGVYIRSSLCSGL